MRWPSPPKLFPRRLVAISAAIPLALAVAGCDLQEDADVSRGRQLFIQQCGSCHVLAEAGTGGTQGPDLDASFAEARASGMDSDTIEGVVESQIENPRPVEEELPQASMPANLVTGDDLVDVAYYVAQVAGVKGIKPPEFTAQSAFATSCGSCHTLKAAQTTGTVGPDLDQVLPGQSDSEVEEQIVDPNTKITPGYPENVMPANFGETFTPDQLKQLVEYLVSSVGA